MTANLDTLRSALQSARFAANSAALAQYARDGFEDRGACGDAILTLKGNTRLAKAAIAEGLGHPTSFGVLIRLDLPPGMSTQHAAVYQAQKRAFRDYLQANGLGAAIREFRCYID